jgi:heptosyltransferase II
MATSVVRAFLAQRPEVGLEVVGRGVTPELCRGLLPPGDCHRLDAAGVSLKGRFDLGVLLPDSFSSAWHLWQLRIPSLGRRGDLRDWLLRFPRPRRHRPPTRHLVEEWDELLQPLGVRPSECLPRVALDEAELARARSRLAAETGERPTVVLCPGAAFGGAKRWPPEYFARLARGLRSHGLGVLVSGASGEEDLLAGAAAEAGTRPLVGLPIREWAAILGSAALVVANDSGASHVAAACGGRVLALFGSTDPVWSRPLGEGHQVLRLGLSCSPCFQRECPLGHLNCMRQLTVERVQEQALAMCGREARPA